LVSRLSAFEGGVTTLGTALAAGLFIRRLPVAANGSNQTFESWNGFPSFTPTSVRGSTPSRILRQTWQAATKPRCLPMRDRSPIHDQSFRRGDNHDPKPVTWTADSDKIMATVSRFVHSIHLKFDSFMSGLPDTCRRSLVSTDLFYRRAGAVRYDFFR